MQDRPLWTPDEALVKGSHMVRFMAAASERWGVELPDYAALHRWSVDEREQFYRSLWDFAGIIGHPGERVLGRDTMPGADFFPDARLNFAENLLMRDGADTAFVFKREDLPIREVSRADMRALVSRIQQALKAAGVTKGDRVAGYLPNMPESIMAMLGATSLGGIWSSCSPDFGPQGVLDRFGQIEPKVLFTVDGYVYANKRLDIRDKVKEVVKGLPTLEKVVVIPFLEEAPDLRDIPYAVTLEAFLSGHQPADLAFEPMAFSDPLYILFSSGTTGVPKCIVHGVGGATLMAAKEHLLHVDERPGDRVFYFTTLGWMMWNWLVGGLITGATLVLYDGSPFHPTPTIVWDYAQEAGITVLGTSAKYIDALAKEGIEPRTTHDLSRLRAILSTGSVLVPESFDYVYENVKPDVWLASMSGGTDLMGCFVGGVPILPVWRGEIQGPCLAMKVEVYDENGQPQPPGEKGELVCTRAFPSMPVCFWNDPDGERYTKAYFAEYPGIWHHGDYAMWTGHGGMMIFGRSDATLNPGGVRIGTAEIYRQVEAFDEVVEALVIGQEWDRDTRVVLFVRLREGETLTEDLIQKIRQRIRQNASPRHMPARVVQVADIPRTKSGKIVELAVRDVVHGRTVKNIEALDNPQALDLYRDLPQLKG